MKKLLIILLSIALLTGCTKGVSQEEFDELNLKYEDLLSESNSMTAEYETLNTDYQEMINTSINDSIGNASDDLFADLIMQGIQVDYAFDGTMLYDGVAQINMISEKPFVEEYDFISQQLSDNSSIMASVASSFDIETLYLKVVDDKGLSIFEYCYRSGVSDGAVSVSFGLDFIDQLN